MVDSIFPGVLQSRQDDIVPHPLIMSTFCKPEIRMLVANMMKTSAKMVEKWVMPSWSSHSTLRRRWDSPLPGSSGSTDSGFMSDDEDNGDPSLTLSPTSGNSIPPPTILLRCREFVPVPSCGNENAISRVDVAREKKFLGWEEYNYDIIHSVIEIPGHHFNVFSESHVSTILSGRCMAKDDPPQIKHTALKIMEACGILEGLDGAAGDFSDALQPHLF